MSFWTDRSRQNQYRKCNRSRFWGYEYGGWGIAPVVPDLDMTLGNALHTGVSQLLRGIALDTSIACACNYFSEHMKDFYSPELTRSYLDLIEGLLTIFYLLWLPKLLERFDVLWTEKEISVPLSPYIMMASRSDALLGNRMKEELGIWSLKTTSKWDQSRELESRFDSQGFSESWCTEEELNAGRIPPIIISYVQMFYIITGQKEDTPEGKIHNSPVYQGYFKEDGLGTRLAHTYYWKTKDGKKTGLGNTWKKFDVATMYAGGIPQWINDILALKIQPEAGNPFESLFICPPAHYRNPEARNEWMLSTLYQEDRIRVALIAYNDPSPYESELSYGISDESKDRILLETFGKNLENCVYMKKSCPFIPLCHGTAGEIEDPFSHGFKWRECNHPQEEETNGK